MDMTKYNGQLDDRNAYGSATAGALDLLENVPNESVKKLLENIKLKEAAEQRVYVSDTEDISCLHLEGPSRRDRADAIFLPALQDGLKKGDLARHYMNISPNNFAMIRGTDSRHKPNLDLIVIAALVNKQPFRVQDINHVLMEIELPGLFTDTYDNDVNLRNYILSCILNYAQDHECPRERWINFTWEALDYLGLEPLQNVQCTSENLTVAEEEMLRGWMEEAERNCVRVDYRILRKKFVHRYAEENGLTPSKVIGRIAQITYYNESTVRDVVAPLSVKKLANKARTSLIQCAIAMGCTLEETNTMLRQSNLALLYPFREDGQEIIWVTKLLKNGIAREMK